MKYKTIDHIVITTENLEACLHFYVDILGMRAEEKNGRYAHPYKKSRISSCCRESRIRQSRSLSCH